ncbi:hypothetical protein AU077_06750 [Streptococcus gallolyticus]|uniref:hypothetical protein n=1 Tax=Streptococcus gallolyticus TaxID=315405 RepID=UPI000733BCF3|nr:hypothetical protein [Streptococcus gallolyticus]ALT81233.1 hypothetical protein AU077_06750 [Streptococcus gallolyticus]
MTEQEYFDYCSKELTRYEARRYQFMGMEWEDLNKADHTKLLEIGNKVLNEDSSLDLYLLNRDTNTRFKVWNMIARTALHYDKQLPTDDRLQLFADSLEEHFNSMVNRELQQADMNRINQLVSQFETELSKDKIEQLKVDMVLAGLV